MAESSSDEPAEWTRMSKLGQLEHSLSNLMDLARVGPLAGLLINLGCTAIGVGIYFAGNGVVGEGIRLAGTGVVSWAGALFAIVSFLGIIKWVINL